MDQNQYKNYAWKIFHSKDVTNQRITLTSNLLTCVRNQKKLIELRNLSELHLQTWTVYFYDSWIWALQLGHSTFVEFWFFVKMLFTNTELYRETHQLLKEKKIKKHNVPNV